jgi:hypothetical protein
MIVRNSWVDAEGDVAKASRADRQGLVVLTILYFVATTALFAQSLA